MSKNRGRPVEVYLVSQRFPLTFGKCGNGQSIPINTNSPQKHQKSKGYFSALFQKRSLLFFASWDAVAVTVCFWCCLIHVTLTPLVEKHIYRNWSPSCVGKRSLVPPKNLAISTWTSGNLCCSLSFWHALSFCCRNLLLKCLCSTSSSLCVLSINRSDGRWDKSIRVPDPMWWPFGDAINE